MKIRLRKNISIFDTLFWFMTAVIAMWAAGLAIDNHTNTGENIFFSMYGVSVLIMIIKSTFLEIDRE